jgi:hypothetical protein
MCKVIFKKKGARDKRVKGMRVLLVHVTRGDRLCMKYFKALVHEMVEEAAAEATLWHLNGQPRLNNAIQESL